MINGTCYDHESVEIIMPNGIAVGITEIGYSDERPITQRYGRGSVSRGWGRGNYHAKCSITLDRDEHDRLREGLGSSHYTKNDFPIIISYAIETQPTITDVLPKCLITKADLSEKQGEDNVGQIKLEIEVLVPILWNNVAAYHHYRDGAPGT